MAENVGKSNPLSLVRTYHVTEKGYAGSASFSINEPLVAVAYRYSGSKVRFNNRVLVWDLQAWGQVTVLDGCSEDVDDLVFSTDGESLICAGGTTQRFMGGEVTVWQTQTWKANRTIEGEEIPSLRSVAVSRDGTLLAAGSALSGHGDNKLHVWNAETGELVRSFGTLEDDVSALQFSPDGRHLAVGVAGDRTASVWKVSSGRKVWQNRVHADASTMRIIYSPDGKLIATCGDKNIALSDAETGERYAILKGHQQSVSALAFSHDGTLLFSGGWNEILIWDVAQKTQIAAVLDGSLSIIGLGLSPDGTTLNAVHSINDEIQILQFRVGSLPRPQSLVSDTLTSATVADRRTEHAGRVEVQRRKYLKAIMDDPDGDAPRLVFADWLTQQGDPRGEFIRVQCRLSELKSLAHANPQQVAEIGRLTQSEKKLLSHHFDDWIAPLSPLRIRQSQVVFQRGFLVELTLNDVDVNDDSLKYLADVPELEDLDLSGSAVTDQGMQALKKVKNLRHLRVGDTTVTTQSLAELKDLKHLVRVSHSGWGNAEIPEVEAFKSIRNRRFRKLPQEEQRAQAIRALKIIVGYFPADSQGQYTSIRYSQSWASNADLVYLQAFPEVQALDLFECRAVTSSGLKHLRVLHNLRSLTLSETGVTDLATLRPLHNLEVLELDSLEQLEPESFRHLRTLKKLHTLNARFCNLGDAILPHVAHCAELRELDLIYNCFSQEGLNHLRKLKKVQKIEIDYRDEHQDLITAILSASTS